MTRLLLPILVSFPTIAALAQTPATSAGDELRGRAVGEIRNRQGEPWAGAEVVLLSRPLPADANVGEPDEVKAVTDAQGRFHAQILRGRPYSAWAWGTPGAEGRPATPVVENVFVQRPVVAREERLLQTRRVVLDGLDQWPGFAIELRVVDQTCNRRVLWIEVKDGTATLPFLVGDEAFVEALARKGDVRSPLARVRAAAGDASELRIALPERQQVSCWVRDGHLGGRVAGTPCAGATVFRRLGGAMYPAGVTDAEGRLRLDLAKVPTQMPEFTTLVLAEGRRFGTCAQMSDRAARPAGHVPEEDLPKAAVPGDLFANLDPGQTLHARVTGFDGQPLQGLTVWCTGLAFSRPARNSGMSDSWIRGVTTDARGRFQTGGVGNGEHRRGHFILREQDLASAPAPWRAGLSPIVFAPLVGQPGEGTDANPITVDLRSICPIELRLTDEGSTPAADVAVVFVSLGKDEYAWWPGVGTDAIADQLGRLRILVPGGQRLGFRAVRGMSMLIRGFETTAGRAGDGPAVAHFQLPPPTGIRGVLREPDGSPGRDRTVFASGNTNNEPATWQYESQPASVLQDQEHNRLRVLLPDDAQERYTLTALIGRHVSTDSEGRFALPLPVDPVPGMLLLTGKAGERMFHDSIQVGWKGESRDDFEWRVRH